jgi:hypothetical protein
LTRNAYSGLPTPGDVPFEEAEAALAEVVAFLDKEGVVPFSFPLP